MWVTATNVDGELKTLGAGGSGSMIGHNSDERPDHFKEMSLPANTYCTKVAS